MPFQLFWQENICWQLAEMSWNGISRNKLERHWLKTRPKPVISGAARQDSTEALLSRGIGEHTAGSYDAALEAYRKILERVCASSFPFPRQVWPLAEQHRVGVIEKFMIQSNHSR